MYPPFNFTPINFTFKALSSVGGVIAYESPVGAIVGRINGVVVAIESSYLACDEAMKELFASAIYEARTFLAALMTPPPPPTPAPVAAKPKAKSRKSTRVCGEQCPACHPSAVVADGVYYCAAGREFNVYFNGSLAQAFPKKEVMQAHALLNNLRTEAIRRRAA